MAKVNLDTAARLDITCRKGDTFSLVLDFGSAQTWDASNLKMEIAPSAGESATDTFSGGTYFRLPIIQTGTLMRRLPLPFRLAKWRLWLQVFMFMICKALFLAL